MDNPVEFGQPREKGRPGLFFPPLYKKKYGTPVYCFLSGALYSLSFYFERLFIFGYIALFFFFYLLFAGKNGKKLFGYSFSFCFGFYFFLYLWLKNLYPFEGFDFKKYQMIIIIVLACVIIPLFHSLIHSAVMLLIKLFPEKPVIKAAGCGFVWVAAEFAMSVGTFAFPWGRAAVGQIGFLPSVQTVSMFGSYFIAFILVFSAVLSVYSVIYKKLFYSLLAGGIVLANILAGTVLYYLPVKAENYKNIAIIQGNIASNEKWDDKNSAEIIEKHYALCEEAILGGAEIVFIPESAMPYRFTETGTIYKKFSALAEKYDITVFLGAIINASGEKSGYNNSAIAIYPDGSLSGAYNKINVVPFGEYIPYQEFLTKIIPFIDGLNLGSFDTVKGNEAVLIEAGGSEIGTLICFDSIFDNLARENTVIGADILAVLTNDSWFKDSAGVYQHKNHSVLRAIENGRYVVRAANTGISLFIDPKGNQISSTVPLTETYITAGIPAVKTKTLYTATGNTPLYAAFAYVLYFLLKNLFMLCKRRFKAVK